VEATLRDFFGTTWDRQGEDGRAQLGERDAYVQDSVDAQLSVLLSDSYRALLAYDPEPDWSRVTAPVLGIYGGLDVQVPSASNEPALRAALESAGNDDFEDFETVDDEIFAALGRHLEHATTKISQRQVEAAGSMALGLWFEQARESYVPSSNRPFGNFMIDTMDMAEMLTREEWIGLSADEQKIDTPLDPAKVFHTVLVNEVQIELGNEAPYLERIAELQEKVDAGSITAEEETILEGAQMVLAQMSDALIYLADIKKDKVLDRLDDNGAPNSIEWVPSDASKGTIALRRLGDMD
jgi:hypothetical protein